MFVPPAPGPSRKKKHPLPPPSGPYSPTMSAEYVRFPVISREASVPSEVKGSPYSWWDAYTDFSDDLEENEGPFHVLGGGLQPHSKFSTVIYENLQRCIAKETGHPRWVLSNAIGKGTYGVVFQTAPGPIFSGNPLEDYVVRVEMIHANWSQKPKYIPGLFEGTPEKVVENMEKIRNQLLSEYPDAVEKFKKESYYILGAAQTTLRSRFTVNHRTTVGVPLAPRSLIGDIQSPIWMCQLRFNHPDITPFQMLFGFTVMRRGRTMNDEIQFIKDAVYGSGKIPETIGMFSDFMFRTYMILFDKLNAFQSTFRQYHGDMKPTNLVWIQGEPYIIDFGLVSTTSFEYMKPGGSEEDYIEKYERYFYTSLQQNINQILQRAPDQQQKPVTPSPSNRFSKGRYYAGRWVEMIGSPRWLPSQGDRKIEAKDTPTIYRVDYWMFQMFATYIFNKQQVRYLVQHMNEIPYDQEQSKKLQIPPVKLLGTDENIFDLKTILPQYTIAFRPSPRTTLGTDMVRVHMSSEQEAHVLVDEWGQASMKYKYGKFDVYTRDSSDDEQSVGRPLGKLGALVDQTIIRCLQSRIPGAWCQVKPLARGTYGSVHELFWCSEENPDYEQSYPGQVFVAKVQVLGASTTDPQEVEKKSAKQYTVGQPKGKRAKRSADTSVQGSAKQSLDDQITEHLNKFNNIADAHRFLQRVYRRCATRMTLTEDLHDDPMMLRMTPIAVPLFSESSIWVCNMLIQTDGDQGRVYLNVRLGFTLMQQGISWDNKLPPPERPDPERSRFFAATYRELYIKTETMHLTGHYHGDMKPDNVVFVHGVPYLLDFDYFDGDLNLIIPQSYRYEQAWSEDIQALPAQNTVAFSNDYYLEGNEAKELRLWDFQYRVDYWIFQYIARMISDSQVFRTLFGQSDYYRESYTEKTDNRNPPRVPILSEPLHAKYRW